MTVNTPFANRPATPWLGIYKVTYANGTELRGRLDVSHPQSSNPHVVTD